MENQEIKINEKKSSHTHIVIVVVAVIALLLSIFNFVKQNDNFSKGETLEEGTVVDDQGITSNKKNLLTYSLYIGLTDKEENRQVIATDVAIEIIKTICIGKNTGYTIFTGEGAHIDTENLLHAETSIVLELSYIDKKKAEEIANDICNRLNIQSILITKVKKDSYYYYFKK